MTAQPDPLDRLPLRYARLDVRLQGPDGRYRPHALITPQGGLPPGIIEGASRADALALGSAAVLGLPDDGFRLPEATADRVIVTLRRLQEGSDDLIDGLAWLHALARAHALGEPLASTSDLMPRCLLLVSVHDPSRPGAKVRLRDVDDGAYTLFAMAAQAARAIRGGATLMHEIKTDGERPAGHAGSVWWVMGDALVKTSTSLHLTLDILGVPGRVVTPGYRVIRIEPPAGAMENPTGWARYQAAQWTRTRAQRIERLRLYGVKSAPVRPSESH
jgi:hypothetical protein